MLKLIILVLWFGYSLQNQPYTKVVHEDNLEARCLDGSPAFLYFHQGTDTDKFLIFFEQGDICRGLTPEQNIYQCYLRSKTKLGSSFLRPDEYWYQGILSTHKNNKFSNWTKAVMGYCDGSAYQGNREPYLYENASLYYRGTPNMKAHLDWLIKNHNFSEASEVVIAGQSAGGYGVQIWSNYITDLLKNPQNVHLIADSSSDITYPPYETDINIGAIENHIMLTVSHDKQFTPLNKECLQRFPGFEVNCFFVQNIYQTWKHPILLILSKYDHYDAAIFINIHCITTGVAAESMINCSPMQRMFVEGHQQAKLQILQKIYAQDGKNSIWYIGCSKHTYLNTDAVYDSNSFRVPALVGRSVKDAVQDFVSGEKFFDIDWLPWPNNYMCAF